VNESRFAELDRKRYRRGLSEEEANELGRLFAEKMGQLYSNARDRDRESLGPAEPSVDQPEAPPEELQRSA
jgi:hypothetical protein